MTTSTLARIADRMHVEYFHPGDTIVREGTHGEKAYIVGDGVAEAASGDMPPRKLAVGERFGRITAVSGSLVDETVRAVTEVEAFSISREDFEIVLAGDKTLDERIRLHYMSRQS